MALPHTEIFCISNEILLGETLDSNSHWLSQRLTKLGARVKRVVHLEDHRDTIVDEYRRFLGHDGEILITIGGLGPTDDDNTLNYLAAAAELPFEICNDALQLVQTRYEELHDGEMVESRRLNDVRKKMAYMPRGATPLENKIGVAPGMLLGKTKPIIISLPGDPREMRAIFQSERLAKALSAVLAGNSYAEDSLIVSVRDESLLIPAMRHVNQRHEDILIKSRSFRDETGLAFRLHLSTFVEAEELRDEDAESKSSPNKTPPPLKAVTEADIAAARTLGNKRIQDALEELCRELDSENISYRQTEFEDGDTSLLDTALNNSASV